MNLRSTLPTPETTAVPSVMEVSPTANTIEDANAGFDAVFGDGTPKTPAPANTTTALVQATPTALESPRQSQFVGDDNNVLQGDWDYTDVGTPNLRIVAGSGELSKLYPSGSTIFADEVVLDAPDPRKPENNKSFVWAPVSMRKSFREVLSQEDRAAGVRPRLAGSAAEVVSLGGTTQWVGNNKPSWEPTAAITVLLRKPEWLEHPGYSLDVGEVDKDGKPVLYAIGVYYAAGTGYREVVKLITAQASTSLKVPKLDAEGKPIVDPVTKRPEMSIMLHKYFWTWKTDKKAAGEFTVVVPVVRVTSEQSSKAVRDYLADFLASQV